MADEVNVADSFQKLVDSTKTLDNKVVKAAEGIVKVISPSLAESLVKLDKNSKKFYGNLYSRVAGNFRRSGTNIEE
ncbi:hypothetical protein [Candidatus Chlorohelix sp.]|uniref:hypothetical protein n=1 Tax=Candidatus Chlorohelix sp. TaxID=3139201 RepID=UPI00303794AC